MSSEYKQVKRMTTTGRIIHWANAISMVVAVITGLYIGHPYYQTFIADGAVDKYVMAWNRWGHFIVAIIFDVTSVLIAYLFFFSRFEKAYKKVIPTGKNIAEFFAVIANLLTLNRSKKFDSAHADSFNAVYFLIFHLLLAWMLFTGLQLYVSLALYVEERLWMLESYTTIRCGLLFHGWLFTSIIKYGEPFFGKREISLLFLAVANSSKKIRILK